MSRCNCQAYKRQGFHRPSCPMHVAKLRDLGADIIGPEHAEEFAQVWLLAAEVVELVSSRAEQKRFKAGQMMTAQVVALVMCARQFGATMTEAEQDAQLRQDLANATRLVGAVMATGEFRTEKVVSS